MFSFFKREEHTKDLSKCKFDYKAYVNDRSNGVSDKEIDGKIKNLDYWVSVKDC